MENINDVVESILTSANCSSSLIEEYKNLSESDKLKINTLVKKIFFSRVTITDKIIKKFACRAESIKTIKKIIECQIEFNRQEKENKEFELIREEKYEFKEEYHTFMDNIFTIILTGKFGNKDFFAKVVNEYNKLPKSGQYDICVEVFNEFFSGGQLDLNIIIRVIYNKIKYYKKSNIDIDKLKQEENKLEEDSKKSADSCISNQAEIGGITVEAGEIFRAMRESAKKLESHPKYDFSGVRFEDGTENNETDNLGFSKTKK